MSILFILASFLFLIWSIRSALFWFSLWQLKEYRFDRMHVHLKETRQGRNLLLSPFLFVKLFAILAFIAVIFKNSLLVEYQIFVSFIFFVQLILVVKEIKTHAFKRPVPTVKTLICLFFSLLIIFMFYLIPIVDKFLWLLILDRMLTLVIIPSLIFFFSFPTDIYRDWKIDKAVKKLRENKKVFVVGITGSYGKSSTKEYMAQILSHKFNVLYTKGTNNTPIGIANTILSGLKKDTQIFIVEMGAYKIGEIAQICQMVNPRIGVLTSVNKQHISLFGNIKNTIKAKYELIESLPSNGLAIFNGNNANALKLYDKAEKRKILYAAYYKSRDKSYNPQNADIYAYNIFVGKSHVTFDLEIRRTSFHLRIPLVGKQNIENILPGVCIAFLFGMKTSEIEEAASMLNSLPKTMSKKELINGGSLIDDTFNSNPDAVLAALDYMTIYKGKKILIMQPMIELGKDAARVHFEIGRAASNICDYLFLTNDNFFDSVLRGIKEGKGNCKTKVVKMRHTASFIRKNITKDDIVLFEGKEAASIYNLLLV